MQTSSRLYHCCRCHAQVIVCSRCDHGQRYCAGNCRHKARSESQKRASEKYQSTRMGRFNNAARQHQFRQRQQQKVTHQGSVKNRLHGLLKIQLRLPVKAQNPVLPSDIYHCHHCGGICEPFLRHDFLHSSQFKRPFR